MLAFAVAAAAACVSGCCRCIGRSDAGAAPRPTTATAATSRAAGTAQDGDGNRSAPVGDVALGELHGLLLCAHFEDGNRRPPPPPPGHVRLQLTFVKIPRRYNWALRPADAVYLTWYGPGGDRIAPVAGSGDVDHEGTAKVQVIFSDAFQAGPGDVRQWVADVRPPSGATALSAAFGALRTGLVRVPPPPPPPPPPPRL